MQADNAASVQSWKDSIVAAVTRAKNAEEERDRYREALEFYADPSSYENATPRTVRPVITDQGARARKALA